MLICPRNVYNQGANANYLGEKVHYLFLLLGPGNRQSTVASNTTSLINEHLEKVADQIGTEDELMVIGIELNQSISDINRIRKDNIRDLPAAAFKVLHKWVMDSNITNFESMEELLDRALKEAKKPRSKQNLEII